MAKAKYWKLPGGRYGGITARGKRFIVDSLAKAKAKLGKGTKRVSKTTRKSNPKKTKKVKKMAKKKRRSGKSMTRTAFKLIRLGALVAPAIGVGMRTDLNGEQKFRVGIQYYTGYDYRTGTWNPSNLLRGWGAYLGAVVATYGIPKIASILRRL